MIIDRFSDTTTPAEKELWLAQMQNPELNVDWKAIQLSFDDVCNAFIENNDRDPEKILADARIVADALDKTDFLDEIEHYRIGVERATSEGRTELAEAWTRKLKQYRKSFDGCFTFVNTVLDFHITSTARLVEGDNAATAHFIEAYTALCMETVVRLGYKPPQGKPARAQPSNAGAITGAMETIPSGEAVHILNYVMAHSDDLAAVPARKFLYNHTQNITVRRARGTTYIDVTTGENKITIGVDDIGGAIKTRGKAAQRILNLILQSAAHTCIDDNGQLFQQEARIPIKNLVGPGMYKTRQSAEKALKKITPQLAGIVTTSYGRGSTHSRPFFIGIDSDASEIRARINPEIAWGDVLKYYTYIPDYYRTLPPTAASLFFYIFLRARQNAKAIKERGYFTIGYRAIWDWLGLPDDTATKNPGRDIKDPIDTAIEQIEEAQRQRGINAPDGNPGFTLEPTVDDDLPITQYLDTGYLKVGLKGEYSEHFSELATKTRKKLHATTARPQ